MQFQKATKKKIKLRLALCGPTGSGKSFSALAIGMHLPGPLGAIDTERRSLSKYAGLDYKGKKFDFDVLELTDSQSPASYVEAIKAAQAAGFGTLIIDSLSHAWMGTDGALEQVDKAAKRSQSGNSFTAWRDITPQHNALVAAMLGCEMHLIVTMRSKMEYVLEDVGGKKAPRKVGMAPVQREGVEYEFDVIGDMNLDNDLIIGKTRCHTLAGKIFRKPGAEVAAELVAWLADGVESTSSAADPLPVTPPKPKAPRPPDTRPEDAKVALAEQLDTVSRVDDESVRVRSLEIIIGKAIDIHELDDVARFINRGNLFSAASRKALGTPWMARAKEIFVAPATSSQQAAS